MEFLKKLAALFFRESSVEEPSLVKSTAAIVTDEEAYIPYRSEVLNAYLLSRNVDLKDPLDASVKIKKLFKATPDTKVLNGTVNSTRNVVFSAGTNVVVMNLTDLVLTESALLLKSAIKDTIVIINVARNIRLSRNAKLMVQGIAPDNVLINHNGSTAPSLLANSSILGTIITGQRLLLSGRSSLTGETLRSSATLAGDSSIVNKTTENKIKLQKQRDEELKRIEAEELEKEVPKKKASDEKADNSIFEKPRWN